MDYLLEIHIGLPAGRGRYADGASAPKPFQCAANFGREDHRDGEKQGRQCISDEPGKGGKFDERGEQDQGDCQKNDTAQEDHCLCVPEGIQHCKEDQRDEQNIKNAQPVETFKNKEDVIEEIRHG